MESAAFLFDSFRKKEKVLRHFIRKTAKKNCGKKELKKMRLSVKKMRAILALLNLSAWKFKEKDPLKHIHSLFKKSGRLRENLVNRRLLRNYWLSPKSRALMADTLQRQIKKDKKRLWQVATDFEADRLKEVVKKVEARCIVASFSELRANTNTFIAAKINLIRNLSAGDLPTRELHSVRRHLREITALADLFSEAGAPVMPQQRLKRFKRLLRLLGDWHDRAVFGNLQQKITARLPKAETTEEWLKFSHKLQAENQDQVKLIKKQLWAAFP